MPPTTSGKGQGFQFNIDLGSAPSSSGRLLASDPLQILVVADCSGRRARAVVEPLSGRRVRPISVDNAESVFAGWGARLDVRLAGVDVSLEPRSLEDLHPDQLLTTLSPLRDIQDLKRDLDNPVAVERLRVLLGKSAGEAPPAPATPPASGDAALTSDANATESNAETLSRLLGGPSGGGGRQQAAGGRPDVDRLIRSIVGDAGAVEAPSNATEELTLAADVETGRLLRGLLCSPQVRALEATWQSIEGLVRNCPDEELVRYAVLDASLSEVEADLSGFGAVLEARHPSVVLVDDYAGASAEELAALLGVLRACASQGAILVMGASPLLAGIAGFDASHPTPDELLPPPAARAAWEELMAARSEGAQLALVLPRCLVRQPYGKLGEPLERLAFEELLGAGHEAFVWGNGAYLAARALSVRHARGGSHLDGGIELREMPVVRLPDEDGLRLQPSAERWLSERVVDRLRGAGFAVLQGILDTDRIRVYV
jgi:hypothetical protein